jgi:hypothetical protein
MASGEKDRTASASILERLGSRMRKASGDPMQEELPERIKELLLQLDEAEEQRRVPEVLGEGPKAS